VLRLTLQLVVSTSGESSVSRDAAAAGAGAGETGVTAPTTNRSQAEGMQFTCFTSTKVQILKHAGVGAPTTNRSQWPDDIFVAPPVLDPLLLTLRKESCRMQREERGQGSAEKGQGSAEKGQRSEEKGQGSAERSVDAPKDEDGSVGSVSTQAGVQAAAGNSEASAQASSGAANAPRIVSERMSKYVSGLEPRDIKDNEGWGFSSRGPLKLGVGVERGLRGAGARAVQLLIALSLRRTLGVCGLKLLVYEALSYECMQP
jgi:hypothetical protein